MTQTKAVQTEIIGLDGCHSLVVWEGLELWASKQKVFLYLTQTTTGGCEFSGVGSKGSNLPVTSLLRVVFQSSCVLPRVVGRGFSGVCSEIQEIEQLGVVRYTRDLLTGLLPLEAGARVQLQL